MPRGVKISIDSIVERFGPKVTEEDVVSELENENVKATDDGKYYCQSEEIDKEKYEMYRKEAFQRAAKHYADIDYRKVFNKKMYNTVTIKLNKGTDKYRYMLWNSMSKGMSSKGGRTNWFRKMLDEEMSRRVEYVKEHSPDKSPDAIPEDEDEKETYYQNVLKEYNRLTDRSNIEKEVLEIAKNQIGLLPLETISERTGVPMEKLVLLEKEINSNKQL